MRYMLLLSNGESS